MKLKLKDILEAYKALQYATIVTLEDSEQRAFFKLNRHIYATVKPYMDEEKEVLERLKPANFNELLELQPSVEAGTASSEDVVKFASAMNAYQRTVNNHLSSLLNAEHDLAIEPIAEAVWVKVQKENKWSFAKLNAVSVFTKYDESCDS